MRWYLSGLALGIALLGASEVPAVSVASCAEARIEAGLCQKAVAGDGQALYDVGMKFFRGLEVNQDIAESFSWFKASSDKGYGPAFTQLGKMAENGQGGARDYVRAYRMYRAGVSAGDHEAEYRLGLLYLHGYGVVEDKDKAADWLKKARDGYYAPAEEALKPLLEELSQRQPAAKPRESAASKNFYNQKNTLSRPYVPEAETVRSDDLSFIDFLNAEAPWWTIPAIFSGILLYIAYKLVVIFKDRRRRREVMKDLVRRAIVRSAQHRGYEGHNNWVNKQASAVPAGGAPAQDRSFAGSDAAGKVMLKNIEELVKAIWGENEELRKVVVKLAGLTPDSSEYVPCLDVMSRHISDAREKRPLGNNIAELDLLVISLEQVLEEAVGTISQSSGGKFAGNYRYLAANIARGVWNITDESYAERIGSVIINTIAHYERHDSGVVSALSPAVRTAVVNIAGEPGSSYRSQSKLLSENLKFTECTPIESEMILGGLKFFALRRGFGS